MTVLERIVAQKRKEVRALQQRYANWDPPAIAPTRRDFRAALRQGDMALIAEFKRKSPSRGELAMGCDPATMSKKYECAGASAISVLTDKSFFAGELGDLVAARRATALPVLRKDIIIDRSQLAQTAHPEGPDAVLLIAGALERGELQSLRELAARCGQAALVEVHDEAELERALESGAEVIGINNRDLRTFEVSIETTLRLRPHVPDGVYVVSESGIHKRGDVLQLIDAGVHAVLIGEALMTADDVEMKVRELLGNA